MPIGETALLTMIGNLNQEFIELTGREAFGYVAHPTPTTVRFTFGDGTVKTSAAEAYDYMSWLIDTARNRPQQLSYPFDQELTPAQDLRTHRRHV